MNIRKLHRTSFITGEASYDARTLGILLWQQLRDDLSVPFVQFGSLLVAFLHYSQVQLPYTTYFEEC